MDLQKLREQMGVRRQEIGQRYADLPKMEERIRADLFGGDKTLSSLRENESKKIRELYDFDKGLAASYQSPTVPNFIDDPGSVAQYGNQQLQQRAGELADVQKGIANRRDVLGDALEKSLKMLNYGLEAAKLEYAGMQDEFDNLLKIEELNLKKRDAGSANQLPNFLQQLMGFQQKSQAVTPAKTGKTVTKAKTPQERSALVSRIQAQNPGQKLNLTYNRDGTISYSVLKPQQQYATAEEAPLYENAPQTLRQMLGLAVASNPKQASEMEALYKLFVPESETFGTDQWEVKAGVAGQPVNKQSLETARKSLTLEERVKLAQQAIDEESSKSRRQQTYNNIIRKERDLAPYLSYE